MASLRVGCIGCGYIARRHMENVRNLQDVAVGAFADIREDAAAGFRAEFGGRYATTAPARLLDDPEIDAVLICTHHDSHTPLSIQAAQSGKHVLLEKPMALTPSECRQISQAVEAAGVVLSVNFKFRFTPAVLKTKEFLESPLAVVGQLSMDPLPQDIWVRDPVRGGGLILATACHVFDLIYWLTGSEPERVSAEGYPSPPEQGCNVRAVAATLRFANGSVASLFLSDAGENPYLGKWPHQVFDGKRSAILTDHFRQVHLSGTTRSPLHWPENLRTDGTYEVMRQFVEAIRKGNQPAITVRDGLRATLVATKILKSLHSGKAESISLDELD